MNAIVLYVREGVGRADRMRRGVDRAN